MKIFEVLKRKLPIIVSLGLCAILVVVDRVTKSLVIKYVPEGASRPGLQIGDFSIFNIIHIHNEGAAFGILSGKQTFLIIVTGLFLILAILFLVFGKVKSKLMMTSLSVMIAGGIGNLIDRISQGYVVDFIELDFVNFSIFNFADICVVVGAVIFSLVVVCDELRDYKAKRACDDSECDVDE